VNCSDDDRRFILEDAVPDQPSVPVSPVVRTEVIVGWRVWKVSDQGLLRSVFMSNVWPAGEPLRACCAGTPRLQHGIHAFAHRFAAEKYLGDETRSYCPMSTSKFVFGEVSLWGTVVVHGAGYRSAYAYPRRIFAPMDIASVANGLRRTYGVEVETW
jgi:hypothetical protein